MMREREGGRERTITKGELNDKLQENQTKERHKKTKMVERMQKTQGRREEQAAESGR